MHLVTWDSYYLRSASSVPYSLDCKGEIRVYLVSQSSANASSYLRLDHYARVSEATSSRFLKSVSSSYRACGVGSCTAYASTIPMNIAVNGYRLLGSTYHTVYHDAQGGGSFTCNGTIKASIDGYQFSRDTSFYVPVPAIPRYANITSYSVTNRGLNQIRVSWGTDKEVDQVQYSLSGGSWTNASGFTFDISGLNPGTQYSVKIRVKSTESQLWTESSTLYATTTQVAQITPSNVNFDIDDGITFAFTNPSGSTVDLYLESPNGTSRVTRTGITSPYTLTLNTSEKNTLFGLAPTTSSLAFRFRLRTAGNNNYNHYRTGTASITNANPTFNNFTYADVNSNTTALTGNNQRIVKGVSNVRVTISTANKMVAQKEATAINYTFIAGNKSAQKPYSRSSAVTIDITGVDSDILTVKATDSRNLTKDVIKNLGSNFLEYAKPNIENVKLEREGDVSTTTKLIINGTWWNKSFGAQSNTLTMHYRYKKSGASNYGSWTARTATRTGDTFTFSANIPGDLGATGFSADSAFDVQVRVQDRFGTTTEHIYTAPLSAGIPLQAFGDKGVAFGAPYDESLGGAVQVTGKINGDTLEVTKITMGGHLIMEWREE